MTDHNAEGGKMVEPCAWCRNKPVVFDPENSFRHKSLMATCETDGCFEFHTVLDVDEWNAREVAILAQRKKDFEAGRKVGIFTGEYSRFDDFDEYLKGERK